MYSNRYYLKSKLRMVMIMLLSVIMALSLFFASACSDDDDDDTEKTTSNSDTQTILNGNFEFFSDSDDETYIIYTPNNWSSSTSGSTNYVMNGIVDTSDNGWDKIDADSLAATLDYNNALDEDSDDYDYDDEYVDYNGMKSRDIPYKNTYAGINGEYEVNGETYSCYTIYKTDSGYYYLENADDDDPDNDTQVEVFNPTVDENGVTYYTDDNGDGRYYDKVRIDNPGTHNTITSENLPSGADYDAYYVADSSDPRIDDEECTVTINNQTCIKLYADDDGNYFYDEELETPYESHVLMIHNYVNNDTRYGTAQSYSSSTSVTLEPNTAAELSVWVKTSELIYDRDGNEIYEGRGAYIEVEQTVGGTSVDSLYIENIRTDGVTDNNGWVKYTIYVNGCDFAASTISITVGLGQADSSSDYSEVCEGYAFFDDVQCTVYTGLDKTTKESVEDAGYTINTCDLTSEEEDKIFSLDDFYDKVLDAKSSYYFVDLSSQTTHIDTSLYSTSSNTSSVSIDYTRDSDYYIVSENAINGYNISNTSSKYYKGSSYKYNVLTTATLDTSYDVLGVYNLNDLTNSLSSASDKYSTSTTGGYGYSYYSDTINSALSGATALPTAPSSTEDNFALVMLSAYGAAYTATITDTSNFYVGAHDYKIVSFWLKTSDMNGFTAATISLYGYQYDSDGNLLDAQGKVTTNIADAVIDTDQVSSLSIDTSSVTFDVGDEEDIYDGWVQCFFYVENTTDYEIAFEMHVGFGNTTIKDTTAADYKSGYLAVTNIQTIDVDEDIFSLASTGDYAASFTLSTSDARENHYFDTEATVDLGNIESNITSPSSYTGVNGGSASVVYKENIDSSGVDSRNNSEYSGLINQDYWDTYLSNYEADTSSNSYKWVQILLNYIMTSDECAYDAAFAKLKDSGVFGSTSIQPLLIANTIRYYYEDDETTVKSAAMNYGYIANSATSVSSDSYEIITVKVYVSKGAVAYVYLTEKDGNSSNVMSLELPEYSLWYDNQGNVLDGEPDYDDDSYKVSEHIVYYIRDDGLYEDKDGTTLYANFNNYSRLYYDQKASYYAYGETTATLFEDLDNDVTYYTDTTYSIESPHYLVAYDSDGSYTRVFRFDNSYFNDTSYHYIITDTDDDDEEYVTYSDAVEKFIITEDMKRYTNSTTDTEMYSVIDARYDENGNLWGGKTAATADISKLGYDANGNYVADTWQTVNFYIHTGDTSYSYTLELWSGARETTGVSEENGTYSVTNDASMEGSFVAFDYSTVTVDEDSYSELLSSYTSEIIVAYVKVLYKENYFDSKTIEDTEQNISYYTKEFEEYMLGKYTQYTDIDDLITAKAIEANQALANNTDTSLEKTLQEEAYIWQAISSLKSVVYYTYSLYDDAGYVPFNTETAEDDETGYDYSLDDYEETLVFLSYATGTNVTKTEANGDVKTYYVGNYVTFVDYSASDVTVDSNIAADEDEEEEDDDSELNVWLLVASIILAVVLIFTMLSLLVRDIVKRIRRRRVNVKNVYSSKRKHYIRKLGLTETTEEPEGEENTPTDGETNE